MNRRAIALTLAVAASFVLAGCSAPAGSGSDTAPSSSAPAEDTSQSSGQTTEEACAILSEAGQGVSEQLADVQATSDPAAAAEALDSSVQAFEEALPQIENTEVLAAATTVRDFYVDLADVVRAVVVDGDASRVEELTELTGDMQTIAGDLAAACGPQG